MEYIYHPGLGIALPKKTDPSKEILSAVRPSAPVDTFDIIKHPREHIAIGTKDGHRHLIVHINCQWRDCGIITDMSTVNRHLNGPLTNFHLAWVRGKAYTGEVYPK